MSKHTPGPWKVTDDYRHVVDATNTLIQVSGISLPCGHVPSDHVSYANARLLAAAPDLLEALTGVLPYMEAAEAAGLVGHEGCHWPVELVRAAIAKAVANE